jgi:MSHA biogenesis protein MshI
MRLFSRPKKNGAWLAIVPRHDGLAAVSVAARLAQIGPGAADAGAMPVVTLATFFPGSVNADALERAGKELHSGDYRGTTVLAGGDYQLMSADAPNVPRDERKAAMRWRLKDILDFPVDEATFDMLDIPVDAGAAARPQQSVFAVAARNSIVKARQQLFAQAKVRLIAVDVPEMAQRNVSVMLERDGRGVAMLSFGEDGGLLTVSWRGELYLSRRIDVTLAQLLEQDHERKHQAFDKITLELQRSLDHFERQFSFISVAKLVLAPTGSNGLDEYLSSNLYTRVETLDLATVFDLSRVPELADAAVQQRFFLALGAALRGTDEAGAAGTPQQINLFNEQFEETTQRFTARTMAIGAGVLALSVAGAGIHANMGVASLQREADAGAARLDKVQKRLAAVNAEYTPRPKDPKLDGELEEANVQLDALHRVADTIQRGELGNTRGYAEYFRALARQRVEGLWLTGVSIGGAGQDIGVRGRALDPALVPGFLGRLRNEQVMQGTPVGSLQIGEAAALKVAGKDGKEGSVPAPYVEFSLASTPQGKPGAQP